jgi:hypothetical protein
MVQRTEGIQLTNGAHKDLKRPTLDICSTSKIDELDIPVSIEDHILVLDISVYNSTVFMQMPDGLDDLAEDAPYFFFFHIGSELDVVEEVHTWNAMRQHLDVIVDVVLKKVDHLHDVRMPQLWLSKKVHNMDLQWYSTQPTISGPSIDQYASFGDIFDDHLLRMAPAIPRELDLTISP